MRETLSKNLGVQLGPFVPIDPYDKVAAAIRARFPDTPEQSSEHSIAASVGWLGLGYRARAAAEHLSEFRELFDLESASAEQHYAQDNHFFGFVTNAAAAAESLLYAAHAIALGFEQTKLSDRLLERRRRGMIAAVGAVRELEPLAVCLDAAFNSDDALFDMRVMLLHRGRPPRNYFVGGEFHGKMTVARNPKATPGKWVNDVVFSAASCDRWATWLEKLVADSMGYLLAGLDAAPDARLTAATA